jgi:amino acid transporter
MSVEPAGQSPTLGAGGGQPEEHHSQLRNASLDLLGTGGMSMGSVAVTASVALTLGALVAVTGFASPVTILICGVPMLFIALAFMRLNHWRVNCGATYAWGARTVSPSFGFGVGWLIFLAYVVGLVSIALPVGPYLSSVVGQENNRLVEVVIGVVAVIVLTYVAYVGIRPSARLQIGLLLIEYVGIAVLVVYSLVAVFGHGAHALHFHLDWLGLGRLGGIGGLVSGALIAVYMYSGWDTAMFLNEETRKPRVTPGTAVVVAVALSGFLFALVVLALEGAVSTHGLESHADALSYIAQVRAGSWLRVWMILAVGLSALGSVLGSLASAGRITFAMASDGVFPHFLGSVHRVHKTPATATLIVGGLGVVGVILYTLGSASVISSFGDVVDADGLIFGLFYAATGITCAVYFRRMLFAGVGNALLLVILPIAAAAFLLYIDWDSVPGLGGWTSLTLISMYVMAAIGVLLLAYARQSRAGAAYFAEKRETFNPADAGSAVSR